MASINLDKINHLVLHKQHLAADSPTDDIVQITRDISGLHATGAKEPYLALFARTGSFVREQLDNELYIKRTMGKIRCMRATLYILPTEMIPVAYAATKAMMEKLSQRYAEFRGISANKYQDVARSIMALLKGREMTAAEIKAALRADLHFSAVLGLMCDQGLLVRIQQGDGWKAKSYRYALFNEYLEGIDLTGLSEAEAMTLLVHQYLSSFGPATENDITWWIGVSKTKVRQALSRIEDQIVPLSIADLEGDFIALRSDLDLIKNIGVAGKPVINLLPLLDPYLMGYKQRERYLRYEHYDKIFDRGGNATSTILVNGRIAGIWDFSSDTKPQIKVYLLEQVSEEVLQQLYIKALQLGRFLSGEEVELKRVSSMVPLKQRTAVAFMSPLKD